MTYPPPQEPGSGQPYPGQQPGPPPVYGEGPAGAPPAPPPAGRAGGDGSPTGTTPTQPAGIDERGHVQRGKVSAVWTGAVVAALLLIALIVFIAQNSERVSIHFLGFDGRISLGLALLIAAVGSVLLVAIPGTLRIMQLRRALRRN